MMPEYNRLEIEEYLLYGSIQMAVSTVFLSNERPLMGVISANLLPVLLLIQSPAGKLEMQKKILYYS